jgi:hypothetical protein
LNIFFFLCFREAAWRWSHSEDPVEDQQDWQAGNIFYINIGDGTVVLNKEGLSFTLVTIFLNFEVIKYLLNPPFLVLPVLEGVDL